MFPQPPISMQMQSSRRTLAVIVCQVLIEEVEQRVRCQPQPRVVAGREHAGHRRAQLIVLGQNALTHRLTRELAVAHGSPPYASVRSKRRASANAGDFATVAA